MEAKLSNERFVWVDIETTGLKVYNEIILEVGLTITDVDLKVLDECEVLIWDEGWDRYVEKASDFVIDMHTKSGLLADAEIKGIPLHQAQNFLVDFLRQSKIEKPPMCGSSIPFDRAFLADNMADLEEMFHYRNIDISTIKELCRRLNPELYAKLNTYTQKKEAHRARSDIHDTLQEAGFYFNNFLYVTVGGEDA